ncbi:MAG: lysylphosphatidylglycerol synthase transmembrane domain-containing protein [Terriglobia bacterium]
MKKTQRRWLGWAIGTAILVLILYQFRNNPQWKNFQWHRLGFLLAHVDPKLLTLAILASLLTYLIRAWRWKFFTDPVKNCSLWTLFKGQILGFSSIYLVGRAGEIVRPAYIARAERLPFTSQLAVWLLERVYDTIALVVLLAFALYFVSVPSLSAHPAHFLDAVRHAATGIMVLCALLIILLVLFRFYSEKAIARAVRWASIFPESFRGHLEGFLRSFASGLEVIQNPLDFGASLLCTAILWGINVTVFWLDFRSLGGRLAALSWLEAALTLVIAAIGLVVQLPGVGGGYQVAVLLALEEFFRVPAAGAASAAILSWATVMVPCLALGVALLIHEGLTLKKLETIAETESQVAVPEP